MRKLLIAFAAILWSIGAFAQWTGSVQANGGLHQKVDNIRGGDADLDLKFRHKGKKHWAGINLYGVYGCIPSNEENTTRDFSQSGREIYKTENSDILDERFKVAAGLDFGWRFNEKNELGLTLGAKYGGAGTMTQQQIQKSQESVVSTGYQLDTVARINWGGDAVLKYVHSFNRDSRIVASAKALFEEDGDMKFRRTFNDAGSPVFDKTKFYEIIASLNSLDMSGNVEYQSDHFFTDGLRFKGGANIAINTDLDVFAGLNNVHGEWRDSTVMAQQYFYHYRQIDAYAEASYAIRGFSVNVRDNLQYYRDYLFDQLNVEENTLNAVFDKRDWQNMISAELAYRFNGHHRISAVFSHSIVRPPYRKLCATVTIGDSEGEYYRGNPDLKPEVIDRIRLGYTISNGHVNSEFSLSYSEKGNTAERIAVQVDDKDPSMKDVTTLYTWVNSQRQTVLTPRMDVSIDYSAIAAKIWAVFNYEHFYYLKNAPRAHSNYEMGMRLDASLTSSTRLSGTLSYSSENIRAFNNTSEYVGAAFRLSQRIIKGLEIYLEGKDLVDKPRTEETWNESFTFYKKKTRLLNRSAIRLGISYNF